MAYAVAHGRDVPAMPVKIKFFAPGTGSAAIYRAINPGPSELVHMIGVGKESPLDNSLYNQAEYPVSLASLAWTMPRSYTRDIIIATHTQWSVDQLLACYIMMAKTGESAKDHWLAEWATEDGEWHDLGFKGVILGVTKTVRSTDLQFWKLMSLLRTCQIGNVPSLRASLVRLGPVEILDMLDVADREISFREGVENAIRHELPEGRVLLQCSDRGLAMLMENKQQFGPKYQFVLSSGPAGIKLNMHNSLIKLWKNKLAFMAASYGEGWVARDNVLISPQIEESKKQAVIESIIAGLRTGHESTS